MTELNPFLLQFFVSDDEGDDNVFYDQPRLVVHIDNPARAARASCYARLLPPGGRIIDLMSSMESHLPTNLPLAIVTGLGMNAIELPPNPRLMECILQDLDYAPKLPFTDAALDACLIAVSVQYLTHPVEVLAEIARVLVPGAPSIVSFSSRGFPTKAVAVWLGTTDGQHAWLVGEYLAAPAASNQPKRWTSPRAAWAILCGPWWRAAPPDRSPSLRRSENSLPDGSHPVRAGA